MVTDVKCGWCVCGVSNMGKKKRAVDFGAFVVRPNPPNTEFRR
jgi:hypothetical protein